MFPEEHNQRTLEEYKDLEINLHRELMHICRKYLNQLGIISIVGIVDIVKQEIIELEKATRKNIPHDENETSGKTSEEKTQY